MSIHHTNECWFVYVNDHVNDRAFVILMHVYLFEITTERRREKIDFNLNFPKTMEVRNSLRVLCLVDWKFMMEKIDIRTHARTQRRIESRNAQCFLFRLIFSIEFHLIWFDFIAERSETKSIYKALIDSSGSMCVRYQWRYAILRFRCMWMYLQLELLLIVNIALAMVAQSVWLADGDRFLKASTVADQWSTQTFVHFSTGCPIYWRLPFSHRPHRFCSTAGPH